MLTPGHLEPPPCIRSTRAGTALKNRRPVLLSTRYLQARAILRLGYGSFCDEYHPHLHDQGEKSALIRYLLLKSINTAYSRAAIARICTNRASCRLIFSRGTQKLRLGMCNNKKRRGTSTVWEVCSAREWGCTDAISGETTAISRFDLSSHCPQRADQVQSAKSGSDPAQNF
jgi:hypothetical protein